MSSQTGEKKQWEPGKRSSGILTKTPAPPKSSGVRKIEKKAGDWECPNCGELVFASKSACIRCQTARPAHLKQFNGPNLESVRRPGDWDCPSCGALVFATKKECIQCHTARPAKKSTTAVAKLLVAKPQLVSLSDLVVAKPVKEKKPEKPPEAKKKKKPKAAGLESSRPREYKQKKKLDPVTNPASGQVVPRIGKVRLQPKPPQLTPIRRAIFEDRKQHFVEQHPERGPDFEGPSNKRELVAKLKTLPKTEKAHPRDYVTHEVTPELTVALQALFVRLVKFHQRAKEQSADKTKKRYLVGMREVLRGIDSGRVRLLLVANNIDENPVDGGLDDNIEQLLKMARRKLAHGHVIFAGTRRVLGGLLGKSIRLAAIGVTSWEGAGDEYHKVLDLVKQLLKKKQAAKAKATEQRQTEEAAADSGTFRNPPEPPPPSEALLAEQAAVNETKPEDVEGGEAAQVTEPNPDPSTAAANPEPEEAPRIAAKPRVNPSGLNPFASEFVPRALTAKV